MNTLKIESLKITLMIVLITVISYSCKKSLDDSLDVTPRDRLTDATVWTDEGTADLFLNDIYGNLPEGNNWNDPFENWSDNSICGFGWPISRVTAQQANFTPSTFLTNKQNSTTFGDIGLTLDWGNNYNKIRKTNLFITNVSASVFSAGYKKKRLGEARFLRAYFYHVLWMSYGGVPLITEPLSIAKQGEDIFHARNTSDETFKFITDELAAIANDLPEKNDAGRITKGAALTLKGWCELFAHKYTEAAATNKKIIDDLGNGKVYDLFSDYGPLFMPENNNNKEGVFYKQYIPTVKGGRFDAFNSPVYNNRGAQTGWGGSGPTQELVDDYDMDNGLPISDPASGYDPQNPYKGREKRFYQTIIYDGSFWYNDTIYTRQGLGSKNEIDLSDKGDVTQTGYYLRKRCNDKITLGADNWGYGTSGQNYYYFRYAEVLLNYAEAQNEAAGPGVTVYDAINKIRGRAGLPPLPGGLSQDAMRTAIRKERRIELAFEDKRWWDLIRWNIAHINLNKPLHGMLIKPAPGGGLTYTRVAVPGGDRKFNASKNYLFPIPQSAIDQNKKLTQNPNY
jgi:hypothetical protein